MGEPLDTPSASSTEGTVYERAEEPRRGKDSQYLLMDQSEEATALELCGDAGPQRQSADTPPSSQSEHLPVSLDDPSRADQPQPEAHEVSSVEQITAAVFLEGRLKLESEGISEETTQAVQASDPAHGQPQTQAAEGPSTQPPRKAGTPHKHSQHPGLESSTIQVEAASSTSEQSGRTKRSRREKKDQSAREVKDPPTLTEQCERKLDTRPKKQLLQAVSRESQAALKAAQESPQHRAVKKVRGDDSGETPVVRQQSSNEQSELTGTQKSAVASAQTATSSHAVVCDQPHEKIRSFALAEKSRTEQSQLEMHDVSSAQGMTAPAVLQELHELQLDAAIEAGSLETTHKIPGSQHTSGEPQSQVAKGPSTREPRQKAADAPHEQSRRQSMESSSKMEEAAPSTSEQSSGKKRPLHGKKQSVREVPDAPTLTRPSEEKFESDAAEQISRMVSKGAAAAMQEAQESPQHRAVKKVRADQSAHTAAACQQSTDKQSQRCVTQQSTVASGQTATSGQAGRYGKKEPYASRGKQGPATFQRRSEKSQHGGKKEQPKRMAKKDTVSLKELVVPLGGEIPPPGESGEAAIASKKPIDRLPQRDVAGELSAGDFEQSASRITSDKEPQAQRTESSSTGEYRQVATLQQTSGETIKLPCLDPSFAAEISTLEASDNKQSYEVESKASTTESAIATAASQEPGIGDAEEPRSSVTAQEPQEMPQVPGPPRDIPFSTSSNIEQMTGDVSRDPQTSTGTYECLGAPSTSYEQDPSPERILQDLCQILYRALLNNRINMCDYLLVLALHDMNLFTKLPINIAMKAIKERDRLKRQFDTLISEQNTERRHEQAQVRSTHQRYFSHSGGDLGVRIPSSMIQESESRPTQFSEQLTERCGTITTRQRSDEPYSSSSREASNLLRRFAGSKQQSQDQEEKRARTPSRSEDSGRSPKRRESSGSSSSRRRSHERVSSRRDSSSDYGRSQTTRRSQERLRSGSESSSSSRLSPSRRHGREVGSGAQRQSRDARRQSRIPESRSSSPSRQTSEDRNLHERRASHHEGNRTRSRGRESHSPRHASNDSRNRSERSHRDRREGRSEARHHSSHDSYDTPMGRRPNDGRSERRLSSRTRSCGPHTPTTTPPASPPSTLRPHSSRQLTGTTSRPARVSDGHHGGQFGQTSSAPAFRLDQQMPATASSCSGQQTTETSGATASLAFRSSQSSPPQDSPLPGGSGPDANDPFKMPYPPQRRSSAPPNFGPRMPFPPAFSSPSAAQATSEPERQESRIFVLNVPIELPEEVANMMPSFLERYGPLQNVVVERIDYVALYTLRMRLQAENAESRAVLESARRLLAEPMEGDPDDPDGDKDAEVPGDDTPEVMEAAASKTQSPLEPPSYHDEEVPELMSFSLPESTSASVDIPPASQALSEVYSSHVSDDVRSVGASETLPFSKQTKKLSVAEPVPLPAEESSIATTAEALSAVPSSQLQEPGTCIASAPEPFSTSVEHAVLVSPTGASPMVMEEPTASSQDEPCTDHKMSSPLRPGVEVLASDLPSTSPTGPVSLTGKAPAGESCVMVRTLPQPDLLGSDLEITEAREAVGYVAPSVAMARSLTPTQYTGTSPSAMEQESPSASQCDLSIDQDMSSSPHGSDIPMSPSCFSPSLEMLPPTDQQLVLPAQASAETALEEAAVALSTSLANLPTSTVEPLAVPARDTVASPTAMEEESTPPYSQPEASTDQEMAGSPLPKAEPEGSP